MVSVIILDNGEPNVIKLTYENLYREIKDIEGAELIIAADWFKALNSVKNKYVCFVEADCLVSSGYFASMMGLLAKNPHYRKLAVFATATGTNSFGNRFFGYELSEKWSAPVDVGGKELRVKAKQIEPVRLNKSSVPYPIQIAYIPGAILRMSILVSQLEKSKFPKNYRDELVKMSASLSIGMWQRGARIEINPNMTYVTTEKYVNDLNETSSPEKSLLETFHKESI